MFRLSRWLTDLSLSTLRLLKPEYVELLGGAEKKAFSVHKNLLISKSTHFAGALREGTFRESEEKIFEFTDVQSDVIAVFVSWLYKDTLVEIPNDTTDSFDLTIRLYEFADFITLPILKNQCLDHVKVIVTNTNWTPKWREITAHYDNSVEDDKMRLLLVDLMAWSFIASEQANVRSTLKDGLMNEEFVVDLFVRINEAGTGSGHRIKPVRDKEWYHVGDGSTKEKESSPAK
jgi:BTB/POZ domain